MAEGEKKSLLSSWDYIWVVVSLIIILAVMLPKCGIHMVQKTEETEILDNPHN